MGQQDSMKGWRSKAVLWLAAAAVFVTPSFAQRGEYRPAQTQNHPGAGDEAFRPGHAGDWLRRYQNLSPAERERVLQNDPGFRRLPPERQQLLRRRLERFSSLPPEQQERVINRMETWEHLTPAQKAEARDLFGQMQQLTPQRRRMLRAAVRDLSAMPPDQRERVIDSPRFRSMFSPMERDIMRRASRLPLAPPPENQPPQ
jgi:Protein of unknown function (DUF3106)